MYLILYFHYVPQFAISLDTRIDWDLHIGINDNNSDGIRPAIMIVLRLYFPFVTPLLINYC